MTGGEPVGGDGGEPVGGDGDDPVGGDGGEPVGGDEAARLRDEVARLRAALDAERHNATRWQELAEERRVTLERLRQHPVVRSVLRVAQAVLPPARRARSRARRSAGAIRRLARATSHLPATVTASRRAETLARLVAALPAPDPDPRRVTVIVLTHDAEQSLRDLLAALRETRHDDLEVVVHDNASGPRTRRLLASADGIRVVRSSVNRSYAAANSAAAATATGDVLCFLNDDVLPVGGDWLDRMLGLLRDDVAAVGAQLVHPPAGLLDTRAPAVSVQHLGIEFAQRGGAVPAARHVGRGADPDPRLAPREAAAATGACLLVDRARFEEVGGFDDRYHYGAEDVDLCWRLRQAGGRVMVAPGAVLYHAEGTTRLRGDPAPRTRRQARNWELFEARFGPQVRRAVTLDRLRGDPILASEPYRVGITVTRDLESAGYGDWNTAHELGGALEELGLSVRYLERYRDAWYQDTGDLDALVALHDLFDVRRVARAGLTTLAWVRNWTDRFAAQPWVDDFDVVLASSRAAADHIAAMTRHTPDVLPLATDPQRFRPTGGDRSSVVLTANHWGHDRGVDKIVAAVPELVVYGKGWEDVPAVAERWAGRVPYDRLADVYGSALVVVDQTAHHARGYGAVNARVFDALAAGALPVTDQVDGAAELFGGQLPTYTGADDLAEVVAGLLADPDATAARAAQLREGVLEHHTYSARAAALRSLLEQRERRPRIHLKTSCPDRGVAHTWGDWHFAHAFARELRGAGNAVHVETADEWSTSVARAADVAVHLKGRSRAPRCEGQFHVIWNISHPEELTDEECDEADLVLVAGPGLLPRLRERTDTPVEVLLQATDERRFAPRSPDPAFAHDVAFVGNSRFVLRAAVRDALAAGLHPAVYGANWERFVDPGLVCDTHVPNEDLPRLYSSVKVLLNDHWEGMREAGIVSNRIFDALACGTVVVSDEVGDPGTLEELFGGAVVTYRTPEDLRREVGRLLADEGLRRRLGAEGRQRVLAAHTFAHRAQRFVEVLAGLRGPATDHVVTAGTPSASSGGEPPGSGNA